MWLILQYIEYTGEVDKITGSWRSCETSENYCEMIPNTPQTNNLSIFAMTDDWKVVLQQWLILLQIRPTSQIDKRLNLCRSFERSDTTATAALLRIKPQIQKLKINCTQIWNETQFWNSNSVTRSRRFMSQTPGLSKPAIVFLANKSLVSNDR